MVLNRSHRSGMAIVAGDAWPLCKTWPSGHRLRRQGLNKGQHPGARSTVRSTVRRCWITHFHPLIFQKRLLFGVANALPEPTAQGDLANIAARV